MSTPLRLTQHGPNVTEIESGDVSVLFSYRTPVAIHVAGVGFYKTEKAHSKTTSTHINRWLRDNGADPANVPASPQELFDAIEFSSDAALALKVTR